LFGSRGDHGGSGQEPASRRHQQQPDPGGRRDLRHVLRDRHDRGWHLHRGGQRRGRLRGWLRAGHGRPPVVAGRGGPHPRQGASPSSTAATSGSARSAAA